MKWVDPFIYICTHLIWHVYSVVKEIHRINARELESGLVDSGSWHDEYKDSAYIFIGGLPYELTEGDIICVFSQ
jgi:RNA-binding motif X-linked protein 2